MLRCCIVAVSHKICFQQHSIFERVHLINCFFTFLSFFKLCHLGIAEFHYFVKNLYGNPVIQAMNQNSAKRWDNSDFFLSPSSFVNKVQMSQLWSESVITVLSAKSAGSAKSGEIDNRLSFQLTWFLRYTGIHEVRDSASTVGSSLEPPCNCTSPEVPRSSESRLADDSWVHSLVEWSCDSPSGRTSWVCISDSDLTVEQVRMSVVAHSCVFCSFNKLPWRCTTLSYIERDKFGLTHSLHKRP